jgi:hypothetical protein
VPPDESLGCACVGVVEDRAREARLDRDHEADRVAAGVDEAARVAGSVGVADLRAREHRPDGREERRAFAVPEFGEHLAFVHVVVRAVPGLLLDERGLAIGGLLFDPVEEGFDEALAAAERELVRDGGDRDREERPGVVVDDGLPTPGGATPATNSESGRGAPIGTGSWSSQGTAAAMRARTTSRKNPAEHCCAWAARRTRNKDSRAFQKSFPSAGASGARAAAPAFGAAGTRCAGGSVVATCLRAPVSMSSNSCS